MRFLKGCGILARVIWIRRLHATRLTRLLATAHSWGACRDQSILKRPYSINAWVLHNRALLRPVPSVSRDTSFATAGTEYGPGRCASIPMCIPERPRVIIIRPCLSRMRTL